MLEKPLALTVRGPCLRPPTSCVSLWEKHKNIQSNWRSLITCKDILPRRHSSISPPTSDTRAQKAVWQSRQPSTMSPRIFKIHFSAINLLLTQRKTLAALQNGNHCSFFTARRQKTKRIADGREWWIGNIGFLSSSVCDFQCPNFASHKSM